MKKSGRVKINTTPMVSEIAVSEDALRDAAMELANADIALVRSTVALTVAQRSQETAITRKTKAETRLAKLRADLGVVIGVAS